MCYVETIKEIVNYAKENESKISGIESLSERVSKLHSILSDKYNIGDINERVEEEYMYIPKYSLITQIAVSDSYGNIAIYIRHTVPKEYKEQHELIYENRVLEITIIEGENKLPKVISYAYTSS